MNAMRVIGLATVGVAAMGSTGAAHAAGYSVATSANTGRGYDRGCAAGYNSASITGASFILNDGSNANCIAGGGPGTTTFNGQTVTVSGTTDTGGRLSAAHDESQVVALPDSAYATASADLATAKVHLSAIAAGFSSATASTELSDTLHFAIAGATAATVTYIPVSFAFDGFLVGTSDPATAFAELNYGFSFGNAAAYEFGDYGAGYYGYYGNYPRFVYAGAPITNGWVTESFASYTPTDTRFSGLYAVTGATADIPIDFRLGLNATNVGLDYTNTGSISIGSVPGVSYTSDSGVFLTASGAGAVPEPAAWALMIAGFGLTGVAARRRSPRALVA